MTFRKAELSDASEIVRLLGALYQRSGDSYGIPFSWPSAWQTACDVILNGLCLVGPNSCAGAIIQPFSFNYEAKVAHVVFWAFHTPREIRIFDALCMVCKMAGATHIKAASHPPTHTVSRRYRKLGLHPTELYHITAI